MSKRRLIGPQDIGIVSMGTAASEQMVTIATRAKANICLSYLGVQGIMGEEGHMMMMMMMNERMNEGRKERMA
ncbi:hypothetical protein TNCV_2187991 [Trichonephila clavipes]|nr:hypothetical protein TNCV_2187991 [Trichonephila clavipes]